MGTLDDLNAQYKKAMQDENILSQYENEINKEIGYKDRSEKLKSINIVKLLQELVKETDISCLELLNDVVLVGEYYISTMKSIDEYKNIFIQSETCNPYSVFESINNVKIIQSKFDDMKSRFYQKYHYNTDSFNALNLMMLASVKKSKELVNKRMKELENKAIKLLNDRTNIELKISDPISKNNTLPMKMLVAEMPIQSSMQILKNVNVSDRNQYVYIDLKNQGNIMICSDYEHLSDIQIDEFIISYIFRFLESFPVGTVNIHIFNQNSIHLYKRLTNSFQSENAGEQTKKVVQIHTNLNDLTTFRDVHCEDVFRKTSVSKPDLYAVYEEDRSDLFNLIILRDGLIDGSGYATAEILNIINSLSKPEETGHKCGLRFLIIDNSVSFEKNLTSNNIYCINSIRQNCELNLQYNCKEGFSLNGNSVNVLHISSNLDKYVQERSIAIADAINKKEQHYISINDVSVAQSVSQIDSILYIPIGKSGGNVVELPLSCKDEDGTVAGQCIGYIAIGQSGSGKSSFFHSFVLNGCMKYSPKDLQFWLLDFKNGGASSKYSDCGIPHIRIIAENNKIDDALCLFQMVLEEMERRNKTFNQYFTDNIIEYNKKAVENNLEYFPRIIIAIDEVQEIFREDNASVLQKLISSISTRMRSTGMHFVMVAQNLSEGKSYMLKDAFMPSATGRICFRVSQSIPRDSGFEEDFVQRKQEISDLKTGEAYVSYGKGTIKKVKMAYISAQDMSEKEFQKIRNRYPEYTYLKPNVIGSKMRLSIESMRQGVHETYQNVLLNINTKNEMYDSVIGEDVYRMSPFHIHFVQHDNSSVALLGSDKQMASSLCTSIAVSLIGQNVDLHLFNGNRVKNADGIPHPFMYLCQNILSSDKDIQNHRLDQFKEVLKDIYIEYLKRQTIAQSAEDDPTFKTVVLIVNDLLGIESFINNVIIDNRTSENTSALKFDFSILSQPFSSSNSGNGQFSEHIQTIINTLIKNGYRYNIHLVLAISGDSSTYERSISGINNILLFNETDYTDQTSNSYYLKEMLKNILNDENEETVAVWYSKKTYSKIRPIIYNLTETKEKEMLDSLITERKKIDEKTL